MGAFRVIDAGGVWVTNPHAFTFADPETGVRYSPAETVKVMCLEGSWLALQMEAKVIVAAPDPTGAPKEPSKEAPKGSPTPLPGKPTKSAKG